MCCLLAWLNFKSLCWPCPNRIQMLNVVVLYRCWHHWAQLDQHAKPLTSTWKTTYINSRLTTCERDKPLILTERTTYRKMDEWMNGHAGVEYRCCTCERDKPLIITERTTYREMAEWMTGPVGVEYRCRTCERDKLLIITEWTTYKKMDEWMTGHVGVEYRYHTCERDKPLILTERTTYRKIDKWLDIQGLNIGVVVVNVTNHLY